MLSKDLDSEFPMTSRHTLIQPPSYEFISRLYHLACQGEVPWVWSGGQRTLQEFRAALQTDFVQFAIARRRDGLEVGLMSAYELDLFHGTAHVRFALLPQARLRVWPFEAAILFANYMFTKFNLRRLCGRSIDKNFVQLRSGGGQFFIVEGCLKGHFMIDGASQDMYLAAVDRERWTQIGKPLLARIVA